VETFGTGRVSDERLEKLVRAHFDLRPWGIIRMLDLIHPMYRGTAAYGHFGREPVEMNYDAPGGSNSAAPPKGPTFTAFSWERTDHAEALKKAAAV